jgi:hypothetical protein
MLEDADGPKEPPRERAERRWRNNALRKKYKEGRMPILAIVDPDTIDYEGRKVRLPKALPPEIGSIIATTEAEQKVVRDRRQRALRQLFSFLYEDMEREKILISTVGRQLNLIANEQMRRRLRLEKIRRKEAGIAQREMEIGK